MRTIRSLLALLLLSPVAMAQAPETKPGATIELQLVTLSDEGFAKFSLANPDFAEKGVPTKHLHFFDREEMKKVSQSLIAQASVQILQTPKLTLGDGRTGTISSSQGVKFVTDLEMKTVEGKMVAIPKNETVMDGITASVCPNVAADRSRISLKLNLKNTTIEPVVPLFPITYMVEPTFEGGSKGQPIPVTQFIQKPAIHTLTTETTINIPNQNVAMIHLGKQAMQTRRESSSVSVVSNIPYINRLFKNQALSTEQQHVFVIVTATITDVPVAGEYVADYRKAIAEGRIDDAKALAAKALAADPACFAK